MNSELTVSKFKRKGRWYTGVGLAILFVALYFSGAKISVTAHNIDQDELTAMHYLVNVHYLYNAQQFTNITTTSAPSSKTTEGVEQIYSAAGAFKKVTAACANTVMGAPAQIRVVENSDFANGPFTEWAIFIQDGSEIKLFQYMIKPGTADIANATKCHSTAHFD